MSCKRGGNNCSKTLAAVSPTPSPPSGKKLHAATIAGVVVGSLVGASIIIGISLILFIARRKKKNASRPNTPLVEAQSKDRAEIEGDDKHPYEVPGKEMRFEMEADHGVSEASPVSTSSFAAELAGDSVPAGARLGVPRIEEPEGRDNKDGVPETPLPEEFPVRPSSREYPRWEELRDEKKADGSYPNEHVRDG
jgi:hypothetical protein